MIEEISLENGSRLFIEKEEPDGSVEITLRLERPESCVLHWGLSRREGSAWKIPPEPFWPDKSRAFGQGALQSPFPAEGALSLRLGRKALEEMGNLMVVSFVLFYPDAGPDAGKWDNDRGRNYYIRVGQESASVSSVAEEIINSETGDHSWSLMHRFNLCHDLLDAARGDADSLALLYVWLRYSAIRQLDWQRRYNTKPRELSHAQDRLTLKLAEICTNEAKGRDIVRMMMTTLGRGGEGQRIRDEILNIMHRHHIKEVAGHFMEEWHQKLHNNATPDDIVICEAYINFLESGGSHDAFYGTLEAGGVSKKRLESLERPIKSSPDFIPHLKDALVGDFKEFLRILKSVHSATDLESSASLTSHLLDGSTTGLLAFILKHRDDRAMSVVELANGIVNVRGSLQKFLQGAKDPGRVGQARDILYLDLALDEFFRTVVERGISKLSEGELVELIGAALRNLRFSYDSEEFSECYRNYMSEVVQPRKESESSPDWSLRAKAVLDRLIRAINGMVDGYYALFQPKAELLGEGFKAEPWAIELFSEEVVRGLPAFALSLLIKRLDPMLRKGANISDWQVVSPGRVAGKVEVYDSLKSAQGLSFSIPTVIVADSVKGDEEPPDGATAIITPSAVDLVSHVAVRARNARMLFATCYDSNCYNRIKSMKGHTIALNVSASGDVVFEESADEKGEPPRREFTYTKVLRPKFTSYAIPFEDFKEGLVGSKSMNLRGLRGRMPEWINLPASLAVPFGVFDEVLKSNPAIAEGLRELTGRVEKDAQETLSKMRESVLTLSPPDEMLASLHREMEKAGLSKTTEAAWDCIKKVWASKWNERAYLSRRSWGIPDEDILMAVLIQEVVEAEYAFVIHTVNPITGDTGELYAEVVPGLGETLVGNYPGRALGFISPKGKPEPRLTSYPSKSIGLYGGGVIFRSDSNVEDLPGYSAAGLYDSVMLPEPRSVTLNYSNDPLIKDEEFRGRLLSGIVRAGVEVERLMGSPQDIEGVYSGGKFYVVQTRPQVGL